MCKITLNNELKGIELSFESKPDTTILTAIKENGFRWHNVKKVWYAKQSEERLQFANTLKELETRITEPAEKTEVNKVIKVKNSMSLWDATRWTEENNVNEKLELKEIATTVRKHLKSRFTMCKLSVTSKNNSLYAEIKQSPFDIESAELKAIVNYIYKYVNSFKYCTCYDPYGDYGSSYNFYGVYENNIVKSYDYTQTEQTEEVKKDIEDFNKQLTIFEQQEEERKEKEYQEYLTKQEESKKAHEAREQEEARQIEEINNNINIIELAEDKKYYIIGSQFAHLNKNNTLEQYKNEVAEGEYYLQDVEITKEVHFKTLETLEYFSNLLLNDFDFIAKTGGSRTEDNRFQSMVDHYNMDEEERKTVEFYSCDCIAVYYNDKLQFVIDAQGHSYSRYVGLCDNVTIQKKYNSKQVLTPEEVEQYKAQAETLEDFSTEVIADNNIIDTWESESWNIYKEAFKERLKKCTFRLNKNIIQQLPEESESLKVAMYKLLKEVDGIQEQFKDADLQQGQKVTLFYISGMGGLITSHITIDKVENSSYAQYDKAVKITFKQPRKQGLYYNHFYSDMLVYDGWQEIPKSVLYDVKEQNGFIVTSGKFSSCDKKAYDSIIEYLAEQNKKPLINTYKPIF